MHDLYFKMRRECFRMRKQSAAVVNKSAVAVDESELLLAYQRQVDADILNANIESVNSCVSSQARFEQAINLLCNQNSDFSVKALTYKSKQRNLLYKNAKVLYFTANFVNVTKTIVDKKNVEIMSVKKYNHAYCYNVAVEQYKSYAEIKNLIERIAE